MNDRNSTLGWRPRWRQWPVDERAEHDLDHGFDGCIIDTLGLRQLGRDGFEVAIACARLQRHRSLTHDRELAVGQAQNAIGFSKAHRGQIPVSAGRVYELEPLAVGRVPDQRVFMSTPIKTPSRTVLPDGRTEFIIYRRDIVNNAPDRITVRV